MCLSLVIDSTVPPYQRLIGHRQLHPASASISLESSSLLPAFCPPFARFPPAPFPLSSSFFSCPVFSFQVSFLLSLPPFISLFFAHFSLSSPLCFSPPHLLFFFLPFSFFFSPFPSCLPFPLAPFTLLFFAPFFFFLPPSPLPLSPPLPLFLPISLFSPSPFFVFLFLFFSPFLSPPPPPLGPIPFSFPIVPFSSKAHSIRSAIAAPASSRAPSSSAASWLPHCPLLSSSCPGSSLAERCCFPFLATLHHSHKQPADAHLCCPNTRRPSLLHCFLTTALLTNVRSELAALRFSASTQTQPLNCFITPCHL
ncbi:proline-rich protein 36-like [Tympanuchus pallidicinctus]|uniref:proline-rich protein 36-like n=1 Tax=Tympanuchus pallidicinctus TaxID=109042 RepID=UPI002286D3ED|nr:proline-rich protein 36-like [Tympanuchus pallidicinctus]